MKKETEKAGFWWNKKGVSKKNLKKLPNGWIRIQYNKAVIMSDWRFWANKGNRIKTDECRDAIKEIDFILEDIEKCMRKNKIGFTD